MSSEPAVRLKGVAKHFEIYEKPRHRLYQMLFRGRKKFYREYWACADIDLEVGRGECLGIVGRNGAGKSTLLQIIAGTLAPSRGEVEVKGRMAALLELGSGFNPEFTGRDNVLLNAAILGLSKKEIEDRYERIVEFADIGEFIERPVKTYSSGMTLRLAFAVMANVDADILIIDEALAVGDAFFTQKCMRFLRDFIKDKTVIFVSHDTNAVCSLCTSALLLENGRIKLKGAPKDVSQKYLEEIYAERQGHERMGGEEAGQTEEAAKAAEVLPAREEPAHRERHIERKAPLPGPDGLLVDMRQELFNNSTLRNDVQIFRFNNAEKGFGAGGGRILDAWLANAAGARYSWIVGGERVFLHADIAIKAPMQSPILGFLVCNGFGQQLFGDNTYLAYRDRNVSVQPGDLLHATFEFQMPILAPAEYYITLGFAEGTPESHVQHHWLHEAITFVSRTSSVSTGQIGIPMLAIGLEKRKIDKGAKGKA